MSHRLVFGDTILVSDNWDEIYLAYLSLLMTEGDSFKGRNGLTKAAFGCSVRADLRTGFPLTRLRKMQIGRAHV